MKPKRFKKATRQGVTVYTYQQNYMPALTRLEQYLKRGKIILRVKNRWCAGDGEPLWNHKTVATLLRQKRAIEFMTNHVKAPS